MLSSLSSSLSALHSRGVMLLGGGLARPTIPMILIRALVAWSWLTLNQTHPCPQITTTPDDQAPRTTLTLPYISGVSESIRRVLRPLRVRVVFRPHKTIRQQLVHPKNPVPPDNRKGVVYSIPCGDCPKVYMGQTGRTLRHRMAEHLQVLRNGDVATSAVAEHVFVRAIGWTCPWELYWTHTRTPWPAPCRSRGTFSRSRPLSTGRVALSQGFTQAWWTPDMDSSFLLSSPYLFFSLISISCVRI